MYHGQAVSRYDPSHQTSNKEKKKERTELQNVTY